MIFFHSKKINQIFSKKRLSNSFLCDIIHSMNCLKGTKGDEKLLEKILFNLIAFSIFIIIFFKIIKKNDTNYVGILVLQALGVAISFIEIKIGIDANTFFKTLRYVCSIVIPVLVILMELRGINFSEVVSSIFAKILMMIGDYKAAKTVLIKMVTKYPESYMGHKLLAKIYEKEGGMRKAIDEYVKLVDIKRNDYKSYFKIADLLNDLGQKNEAIQMLENLMKKKPDSYECSILLGELLCEQARFKEAEKVYQEALKYRPTDFDLYYNLGIVYTMLSEFQMAKEMYEKAAEINHRAYGANYNLGQIALIQGDLDIAKKYFEHSLYGELESKAYYQLAKIYVLKGEKDMAINFLNKAIEIEPELLEMANKEKVFEEIKEHITVSVKMENEHQEEKNENETVKYTLKLENQAREYLESTNLLVRDMNENTAKLKVEEKVNQIFEDKNKQKEKEREKELEKEENQKERGSN